MLPEKGILLRIYQVEKDKYQGKPLYEWIVQKAKEEKMAGATVLRAIEGFGAKSHLHSAKVLSISVDLPLVIEIVDAQEKIDKFLVVINDAIKDSLMTLEKVDIRTHRTD